ncbi:hypothetical protein PsYK624_167390 [Phanerochaete sordida]|uniref:DUF6534 domain-containing protein n=1 Tax=Phanerochaete sordida TaxID=48140 RepID=A0A9P3LMI2_9APHY|nr:hypothetical protein PsYK624_167390 [Phanerochaete sordida]
MTQSAPQMSPPSAPPVAIHLDNTLGAILVGLIVLAVLYGVTSLQVYVYFHRDKRDSRLLKSVVLFQWLLLTVYLAFDSQAVYYYAVTSFMNPLALEECTWSLASTVIIGTIIVATTTLMFAYKIYKLGGCSRPLFLIIPPQLAGFVMGVGIGIKTLMAPDFQELEAQVGWVWNAHFAIQAFSDCTLSAVLCIMLAKRRTGFRTSDTLIQTIIRYSINTCALTDAVSIASVVANATMPNNLIHIAIIQVFPSMLYNSLLALLNSRDAFSNMIGGQVVSVHLSNLRGAYRQSGVVGVNAVVRPNVIDIESQGVVNISAHDMEDTSTLSPKLASHGGSYA